MHGGRSHAGPVAAAEGNRCAARDILRSPRAKSRQVNALGFRRRMGMDADHVCGPATTAPQARHSWCRAEGGCRCKDVGARAEARRTWRTAEEGRGAGADRSRLFVPGGSRGADVSSEARRGSVGGLMYVRNVRMLQEAPIHRKERDEGNAQHRSRFRARRARSPLQPGARNGRGGDDQRTDRVAPGRCR